jgi:hypothetical protein
MTYQQKVGTSAGISTYQPCRYQQKGARMALTDTFVKNVKPSGSATGEKHADGHGLYLHVKEAGKYWRMSYRHLGKQKTLALGVYPAVSLAKARKRRDEARELLAEGLDCWRRFKIEPPCRLNFEPGLMANL